MEAIKRGIMVITFVGSKNIGKSYCINTLLYRILGLALDVDEIGKIPLPSLPGAADATPWPIIIVYHSLHVFPFVS